jgi:putative PIN family toxin of toxin-antitoxin system
MKVLLDTNVLASAAATRGLCADVLRAVFASHELLVSEDVLSELKKVLKSKFGVEQRLIDDSIELLRQDAVLCRCGSLPKVKVQDKDDLPILGAAISANAQVLVTGDKELLNLGSIENVEIVSPWQFHEKLKAQRQRRTSRRTRRTLGPR